MSVVVTAEYKTFLKEIKERIYNAQYDAFKVVNKELINLTPEEIAIVEGRK